jgi:hypothetical protein
MMPAKQSTPLMLLALLVLAALACSILTGGPSREDGQATAAAIEAQSDNIGEQAEATAAAAEATAEAAVNDNGNDNDDDDNGNDNESDDNDNANENDNGNSGDDDDPFGGQGPDDIPVFTGADDPRLVLAEDNALTYNVSGTTLDDVADFYREAMPDEGWELVEGGEVDAGPLGTTLNYEKDGRTASIVLTDLLGPVLVAIVTQ